MGCSLFSSSYTCFAFPWENKWSLWAHGELTVSSRWPRWSRLRDPMITAQSRLGEVTAQPRRGHSSVTARSQLSHGEVTAQSRHLQYDHRSVTARSQLNHDPGHGSVTVGVTILVTVSSRWAHRELTVSSPWAVMVANFFSWVTFRVWIINYWTLWDVITHPRHYFNSSFAKLWPLLLTWFNFNPSMDK